MLSFELETYVHYLQILKQLRCNINADNFANKVKRVHLQDLINFYDVFCFDGYGTLYNRGNFVYPNAQKWFDMLRQNGKQLRLVTNAASDSNKNLAIEANARKFNFSESEVVSSGSLLYELIQKLRTSDFCKKQNLSFAEAYYIGRESGAKILEQCGIKPVQNNCMPIEPIVAISSAKQTDYTYAQALKILRSKGAILLVLNPDVCAPKIDGSREYVSGALCEHLRQQSVCKNNENLGCTTFYLGKPFPNIWNTLKKTFNSSRVLMIGDTLGTDMLGARVAGFDCALVTDRGVSDCDLITYQNALAVTPDWYLQ